MKYIQIYKQKNFLVTVSALQSIFFPVLLVLPNLIFSVFKNSIRIRIGAKTPFKKVGSGSEKIIPDPQHCDMLFKKILLLIIQCRHRYPGPECAEHTVYIHSYL